ncbi:MAG TPA: cysteine--tRNA ligase, partial [Dysgonamonadaceae bacterium]|nr:cysteine--tRNA ligase [Dysgonamonadaceae bacterium]
WDNCYAAMNDDFNTPVLISHLFEGVRIVNAAIDGKETLSAADLELLQHVMKTFVFDVLGLVDETKADAKNHVVDGLMKLVLEIRSEARAKKDWATSDKIRDNLKAIGIEIKDGKDGTDWKFI